MDAGLFPVMREVAKGVASWKTYDDISDSALVISEIMNDLRSEEKWIE